MGSIFLGVLMALLSELIDRFTGYFIFLLTGQKRVYLLALVCFFHVDKPFWAPVVGLPPLPSDLPSALPPAAEQPQQAENQRTCPPSVRIRWVRAVWGQVSRFLGPVVFLLTWRPRLDPRLHEVF